MRRAFQSLIPNSIEYFRRLKDENNLLYLSDELISLLKTFNDNEKIARVSLIKLEHVYYKKDKLMEKIKASLKPEQLKEVYILEGSSQDEVEKLTACIFKHG